VLRSVSSLRGSPAPAERPWVWAQHWLDVLFLHWRVPTAKLRPHVPSELVIDTYDQSAWLSLVLFRLKVRPRGLPFVPGLSTLLELNLRTYVRFADQPGICFLRMLADNRLGVHLAKLFTPLPYACATMAYRRMDDMFRFRAARLADASIGLRLAFHPNEEEAPAPHGSIDEWLVERYTLFVKDRPRGLWRADVDHAPWLVRNAQLAIHANSMGKGLGLDLGQIPDRVHYSKGVAVRFGGFREA
jgi:uncharacterized protein